MIVDSKGLILTNEHVVHQANEITVTLRDGRQFTGKVSGSDYLSDIALVKINAGDLVPAKLGDSDGMIIGETVIAVGNPYKMSNTVTVGVLSGRGRNIGDSSKDFQDLLQTDAAINPGNSGGPLVNVRAEVIGINTAIIPFAQGIGFAIPVNTARSIMEQLIARGKVSRPYIGVYMQDIDELIAQRLELPEKEGVLVAGVAAEGPAAQAGLKKMDIITEIDGQKIKNAEKLRKMVKDAGIGGVITVTIVRDRKKQTLIVKVAEMPQKQ